MEETEKPRYPKHLDVGRIVIEETPEENEEIVKREFSGKDRVRPKSTEVTVAKHAVAEHPKAHMTEDVIKVGKLDVTHLEKEIVETKTIQDSTKAYRDIVDGVKKPRTERKPKDKALESSYIEDIHYTETEGIKPCFDETKQSRSEADTERVTVLKSDVTRFEEPERQIYPKEHNVGRIVIEEISDEQPEMKYPSKPKSTTTTITREHVTEKLKRHEKNAVNVGKLDLYQLDTRQVESKQIEETPWKKPRVERPRKSKQEKPKKDRIDHYRPQGEEFDKAYTYDYKSPADDAEVSQQHVTSEKITVSRSDVIRMEETKKPKYTKDFDIGRIVIEEIPEEKVEVTKRDIVKKDEVEPRRADKETRYEIEQATRTRAKDEVVKVGRLDITDYEKTQKESEKLEQRKTTNTERLGKDQKVIEKPYAHTLERHDIDDQRYDQEKSYYGKTRYEDTRFHQEEMSERAVDIRRDDEVYRECVQREEYPKGDVSRQESREDDMPGEIYRKLLEKPRITEIATTEHEVEDITKSYKEDIRDVGRRDIKEFGERPVETTRMEHKTFIETEQLGKTQKRRKDERPKEDRIDRLQGEEFDKAYTYHHKSCKDDTEVSHQKVTSEKITVSRRDINRIEETDKPRYPKDLDIGRIVIDEIPEEKEEVMMKPDVAKRDEIQRSRGEDVDTRYEVSKKQVKEDAVKVGRLDITDYEKTPRESKQVEERITTHTEGLGKDHKPKQDERIKEDRVDHYRPQGEEFDKAYTYDHKSRTDDTEVHQQQVTSEKITVSRKDITSLEETEKHRYPKDLDIGRIVIEEVPEEKDEVIKRDILKKDEVKRIHEDMETRYQVERGPKPQIKEEIIKVGKLDVRDYEKTPREFERVEESTTFTDRMQKDRKPRKKKTYEGQRMTECYIDDAYDVEEPQGRKPRYDDTARDKVGTEKVTITRTKEDARVDQMERQKYPKDQDVGRIVIDETVEDTPKEIRRQITDTSQKRKTTTTRQDGTYIHSTDVKDVERTYIHKKERGHFGPRRPEEQFLPETEKLDHQRKVRKDDTFDDTTFDRRVLKDLDSKSRKEPKSYTDGTPQQRVTTERITVSRHDIITTEESEKPRYPKDLDIGRIVIEEIAEEKIPERERPQKEYSKLRARETARTHETKAPRKEVIEDKTIVRKEHTSDYEERPWERRTVDDRVTTYTDRLDGLRKPEKEDKLDGQVLNYIDDSTYCKETGGDRRPSRDEPHTSRISTEKITVTRTDDITNENVRRHDHPSDQQVGRIIIDEFQDESERIAGPKKVKKDEQPEKRRPRHLQVEDVETVHRPFDTKLQEDETPRKYISSDKIAITKYDIAKQEEIGRREYPKDLDIGRIVIEEIPEEKTLKPTTKEHEQPRATQLTRKEVKDISKPGEETIKVGKLDCRDVEKEIVESRKMEGTSVTYTERVDHSRSFVTDLHAGETKIDIIDERLSMGTRPQDKSCVKKTTGPGVVTDRIDSGRYVDDKTGKQKIMKSTSGVDAVRGHEVVMDSVWEESTKPLNELPEEPEDKDKPVQPEAITISKDDRSKVQEDVRVSVRKAETQEKKDDVKVRRFKIDESRDIHDVKKYKESVKEKRMKEKPRKAEPEEKPRKVADEPKEKKPKPLKEKQTQTKEIIDERDKKIAYYERKEKERLQRAHEKRQFKEERYQMKKTSSDPWMHVKKHEKRPLHEITATQMIDDDPARYFDEQFESDVRRKRATLPWIEVRRRAETERDRSFVSKKSRHAYHLTQESSSKDRLLLLKIPQQMFLSMQNGEQSKVKEIDIPWMEIEAIPDYGSEALPWIELEAHDPKTGRDRLIMLKIPRDMVLKTTKFSKDSEREIKLRWDDVTKYFEETGQIPLGSSVRMRFKNPPTIGITLPREANNRSYQSTTQRTVSQEGLPTIRLMMPKKFYAAGSWQDRPLINFNPDRRIKVRLNQQSSSKAVEDVRTIRLNEYDRKTNYMPVALTRDSPHRVLLADGTTWKRLDIDDLRMLDKEKGQCNPSPFTNAYEIGKESEAHSFPDLREFSTETGSTTRDNRKIFSFFINGNKDKK